MAEFYTLDLDFLGQPGTIASYLIPHKHGVILVESGPGSTLEGLKRALAEHGYTLDDVTDVLLTHIHLDHAGAAGALAQRHGAVVHVHPVGAPHMINPEKLLASAGRIYGDQMDTLWGEFLPVPEEKIHVVQDEEEIVINGRKFLALDTPGHAYHHHVYLYEDVCFSGDIGGVRLQGQRHLRLPMPPPEFHLEKWRASLQRLREADFRVIVPTHFGPQEDVDWHLGAIERELNRVEAFLEEVMPQEPTETEFHEMLMEWVRRQAQADGVSEEVHRLYETANPSWMSVAGLMRYWRKFRAPKEE